ncbi:Mannan-binding lectin serine protease 1 [Mortierella alpina]|nr:Mannan-binding lectin serine protease 1 [Mortierella alpina]
MRIPSAAVIIASLAVASTTFSLPAMERIIGGEPVKAGELPFVVLFKFSRGDHCSGFLIGPNTVVTAAHCLSQSPHIRNALRFVEVAGMVFKIEETKHIQHPQYKGHANDIGLVFLPKKVPVPYPQVSGDYPQPDSKITAAGFGFIDNNKTYPKDPYKVELIVEDKATCLAHSPAFLSDTHFCTKDTPQAVCGGDSGGPMFTGEGDNIKIVGLVNYGVHGACGAKGTYQYFTFVHSYMQWINEETARFEKNGTVPTGQDS